MGRFYKTAKPQFIDDNIYSPPVELMAKVIGNADTQIKENETALLSLYDKLQAEGLKQDEPRLKEIITDYQSKIEGMASKIQQDPLAFRREMGNIRQLGRTISNDWTKGEVSAIQGNKKARDKWIADHVEKTKKEKGYVTQEDITFAQQKADEAFKGTSYEGPGQYKQWNQEALNPFVDMNKIADEVAKGWEADKKDKGYVKIGSQWIKKVNGGTEIADEKEILSAISDRLLNDKELRAYYNQQMKLGAITPKQLTQKFASAAKVYSEKYGYQRDDIKRDVDANPFALKELEFQNQWKLKMADWGREDKKEIAGPAIDANIRTGEQLDILNKDYSQSLNNLANKLGAKPSHADGRLRPQDVRNKIQALNKIAQTPEQKQAIQNYYNQLNSVTANYNSGQVKASWSGFASVHGTDVAISARKQFESFTKDPRNLYDKKMDFKIKGKRFKDVTLYDIYNNPSSYGLSKDAFTITDPETDEKKKRNIKEIFVQGSSVPIMVSDRKEDWMYNDMLFEFEGDDMNIEGQTSFGNLGIDYVK